MERYSNIPITKLAIVQPPSRGFPGIAQYGIAGILSYLKSVIHKHMEIDPNEEWEELGGVGYDATYYLRVGSPDPWLSINAGVEHRPEDEEIFFSLSFPSLNVESQEVRNISQDLSKNESVTRVRRSRSHMIQFVITGVNIPEDNEDFFNLPPETHDFGDGNFEVPAHQHRNSDGLGGWVAESASVGPNVYLGPDAEVFGNAEVSGRGQIFGRAQVFGNAQISDGFIHGDARISDGTISGGYISGDAQISGGEISGGVISGDAQVTGGLITGGEISGNAVINEGAHITSGMGINSGTYPQT
jgi:hypothetical protein